MGIRSILGKVGSIFSKKPKQRPLPSPKVGSAFRYGHRGTAMGSAQNPDLSATNRATWRTITEDEARGFLDGEAMTVHSSNVLMAQYFPTDQKMMVEFRNGSAYLYSEVTRDMAWEFLQAVSKGSAIWDMFRVRGTKYDHKVPYQRIR